MVWRKPAVGVKRGNLMPTGLGLSGSSWVGSRLVAQKVVGLALPVQQRTDDDPRVPVFHNELQFSILLGEVNTRAP